MQEGHPYATAELDELRSEQRRILRGIPDSHLPDIGAVPVIRDLPTELDRPMVELRLRKQLTDRIAEVSDLLEKLREHAEWRELKRLEPRSSPRLLGPAEQAFERIIDHARTRSIETEMTTDLVEEKFDTYNEVVIGLAVADELASDGYCDPRLHGALRAGLEMDEP